ncbi:hypothetical protein [Anatilimnocola floriformis]|uniref:hypothetical protein n=1 Tax=Anatilimnocola floriformis TaxID=2948575 RepID=UPI0020C36F8D|nr:hypothetical protein [Anatilimnocola floriformis]
MLIIALGPALLGLLATAAWSRHARKILPQLLRFDLTAVMLLFTGFSCLLAISRELRSADFAESILLLFGDMLIVPGLLSIRMWLDGRRDQRILLGARQRYRDAQQLKEL